MSYALHIWKQPSSLPLPSSVEEVDRFLQIAKNIKAGKNAAMAAFVDHVTTRYPCICSQKAESLPPEELAWSDGPINGYTEYAVLSLGLNSSMLEEVLPYVTLIANRYGLSVMDEQAGRVYLA